jgi:general secretion pathway protein J
MTGARGEAGFTLVELLVAVTVMGFMAAILGGSLQFGGRAWRQSQRRSDQATLAQDTRAALQRLLGQVQTVFASADPAEQRLAFSGDPDGLSLVAPLPDAIASGIMAAQRLALAPSARGRALVLTWRLDLPGADGEPLPTASSVLMDGVRALRLAYWGSIPADSAPAWQTSWHDQTRLPGLISITVSGTDPTPDVTAVVAPRVTSSPACRYSPVSETCQHP